MGNLGGGCGCRNTINLDGFLCLITFGLLIIVVRVGSFLVVSKMISLLRSEGILISL